MNITARDKLLGFVGIAAFVLIGSLIISQIDSVEPKMIGNVGQVQSISIDQNTFSGTKVAVELDSLAFVAYGSVMLRKNMDYFLVQGYGIHICSRNTMRSYPNLTFKVLHEHCTMIP